MQYWRITLKMIWFEKIFETVAQTMIFAHSVLVDSFLICYVCLQNCAVLSVNQVLPHVTECRVWEDKIRHE